MTCTKNCNQGRACDCVADLPIQYAEPDAEPMALNTMDIVTVLLYSFAMIGIGFFVGRLFA